jgi:transcriptional regulator with XRE-family HTH domain
MAGESDLDTLTSEALGERLRQLRLRSGLSLRALARQLEISPSAVSQIERGTMRPSVNRLIAYVAAVGAPLAEVFETGAVPRAAAEDAAGPHGFAVRRSWEVAPIALGGGVTFRQLSPVATDGVDFFESVYQPGAVSNTHGKFFKHEGYEVGTITQGELTVEFETETITLGVEDSITFPCSRPHVISNRSKDVTAVATWLIVHR